MTQAQPYGTWDSPISAQMVTTAGVRLGSVAYAKGAAFWAEARPEDDGRSVIVKQVIGQPSIDLIKAPFNARTRVHEYGGGSWWVDNQYLYFVHWDDQRLYRVSHDVSTASDSKQPEAITPKPAEPQTLRYADGCVSADGTMLVCVRERHLRLNSSDGVAGSAEPSSIVEVQNELILIELTGDDFQGEEHIKIIASGTDFYSTPRFSPNDNYLTWVQWSHPQMPWDGTQLMLAAVRNDQSIDNVRVLAGGIDTSVMGAMWSRQGDVLYASDKSGWWNVYRYTPSNQNTLQLTHFDDREVGTPAWVFGTQRFIELIDGESVLGLALLVTHQAEDELRVLKPNGDVVVIQTPYTAINSIAADNKGGVLLHAQPANAGATISLVDCACALESGVTPKTGPLQELKPAQALGINEAWLSAPEAISFPSGGRQAHGFFYPPAGHAVTGVANELPPVIVMGHGGPTSHATAGLKLSIQYWTSRGIAVVDVNYGGSSGFGRDYRRLLNGQWGVVDVQDCVAATEYLSASGRVDGQRMVIRGGSAGGLTVLRALQTSERFAGGTSLYGVTDLEMLAGDTHKFESRYLDGLLGGPYPAHKATYVERSPIHHAEQLSCPILVLQGDEDKVVPPNQSAAIADAAAKKGLPHAYVLFKGEQHGFRQTENIIRALQLELWFYGSVLSFNPAKNISAPTEAVGFA